MEESLKDTECKDLCIAIESSFKSIYDKCIEQAQDDIQLGILNKDASDIKFCQHVVYSVRNYISQLEAECADIKKKLSHNKGLITAAGKLNYQLLEEYDSKSIELENSKDSYKSAQEELSTLRSQNKAYSLFVEKLCDYAGLECDDEEQAMRILLDLCSSMFAGGK